MAYPMANWMESPKYTKSQERDGHKIDDQSDEGDAAGSGKCKKQKHHPDEGDAGCLAKFQKQKHHEGDAGLWPKLKRCFVAGDAVFFLPMFKKQKCHSDVDDADKSDVAVRRVTAIQQSGLALAVSLARNVALDFLQQVDTQGMWRRTRVAVQLDLAIGLLHEPLLDRPVRPRLSAQILAQGYDMVRDVRKSCAPSCQKLGKSAALAIQECLVLRICCNAGSMSDIDFESALEHAFEKQLEPKFHSELHLVRNAICKLGRSPTVFEQVAPKVYCSTLNYEELQALWVVHHGCALPSRSEVVMVMSMVE